MDPVQEWAVTELRQLGIGTTGPIELNRARPWSTTWRVPTEVGTLWLKACGPTGRYEAALTALLAQVAPEWTLQPLAVEVGEGWLLLPDGGPELRTTPLGSDAARWADVVREYAEMQRRLAGFVDDLLAVGVPDLRPHVAVERFDELTRTYTDGELRDRLGAFRPRLEAVCERLASSAVPATLQHDDLHGDAVLCGADGQGPPAFFDWGDAVVSHPFASMFVTGQVVGPDRVVDAYLESWAEVAPPAQLRAELDDVWQLARLSRAWAWARALHDAPGSVWEEWDQPVVYYLSEMLDAGGG